MNSKTARFSNSVCTDSTAFWRISENSTGFVNPRRDPGVASTNGPMGSGIASVLSLPVGQRRIFPAGWWV
jgi:hypothetical protein